MNKDSLVVTTVGERERLSTHLAGTCTVLALAVAVNACGTMSIASARFASGVTLTGLAFLVSIARQAFSSAIAKVAILRARTIALRAVLVAFTPVAGEIWIG